MVQEGQACAEQGVWGRVSLGLAARWRPHQPHQTAPLPRSDPARPPPARDLRTPGRQGGPPRPAPQALDFELWRENDSVAGRPTGTGRGGAGRFIRALYAFRECVLKFDKFMRGPLRLAR